MPLWFLFWILLLGFQLHVANSTFCYQARSYIIGRYIASSVPCGLFGWNRCVTYSYIYETLYSQLRQCCSGYQGTDCNIPICNPPCSENEVCLPGSSGPICDIRTCSPTDCFPGTCNEVNACICSSGFEGITCQTISDGGYVNHCRVTLNDRQLSEYDNDCMAPNRTIYTNIQSLVDLKLEWEVTYTPPYDTPLLPDYILYSHTGIVQAYSMIQLKDDSNRIIYSGNRSCLEHNDSDVNPLRTRQCHNQCNDITPNNTQHSYTLEVSFQSRTGGYKTVRNLTTNVVSNQTYTGNQYDSEPIRVIFDIIKPQHCSHRQPPECEYSEAPALAIFPDNRQDTEAEIQLFGWHDDDSFIKEYKFKMYRLTYDSGSRKLTQTGNSSIDVTWNPRNDPPEISYRTGVYSIEMEIYDNAGNIAKARTLFMAAQENHVQHLDSGSVWVNNEEETPLGFWVTDTGAVHIRWANLFTNEHHIANNFYAAVQEDDTIDLDDLDSLGGNRTLSAIVHILGITRFELGWRKLPDNIITWEDTQTLTEEITINNLQRQNGDIFNFTIHGYDRTNYFKSHDFIVHVDFTAPTLENVPFWTVNIDNDAQTDFYYASRLAGIMIDVDSGVNRIHFSLSENQNGFTREIVGDQIQHVEMQPVSRRAECSTTGLCYCISAGACFDKLQYIWINNCWFIRENNLSTPMQLSIDYSISNYAGITYSPASFWIEEIILSDLSGVEYYPVPENVSIRIGRGSTLYVVWNNPHSCYTATEIVLTHIEGSIERVIYLPGNATTHALHDMLPDTRFQIQFLVIYSDQIRPRSEPLGFVAAFGNNDTNDNTSSDRLSNGVIAGISIAIQIFALMVSVLLFAIIRYLKPKHASPVVGGEVKDPARKCVTKRLSKRMSSPRVDPIVVLGVHYVFAKEHKHIDEGMEADLKATWRPSEDRLVVKGKVPGVKGGFADIKFGVLTVTGKEKTVVVKMNKAGASQEEKMLMAAKMKFLATSLPENSFTVQLIGVIPPPRWPMLIFEYCNSGTLLSWLKKIKQITGYIEKQMIIFTMQTAEGMAFLQDKGIVHRSLRASNVLLNKDAATCQLTAKLYGFGPITTNAKDVLGDKKPDQIPIRYMAPEQIGKPRGAKRIYTTKTDVWAYGILLWQIFSKGAKPYSEKTTRKLKHFIKSGERMGKPADCPNFLYNEMIKPAWDAIPDMRPDFNCILTKLKREYGYAFDQPVVVMETPCI